jgi:histidinol-phosphate/aromatic aminotransferase/cobyric acid decarboxylase-like protein
MYHEDSCCSWLVKCKVEELERGLYAAVEKGKNVRALVVINPGNPTGQCLSEANMKEVVICVSLPIFVVVVMVMVMVTVMVMVMVMG